MAQSKNNKTPGHRQAARKIVKLLAVLAAIVIVLLVFLPPVVISSRKCRAVLLAKINAAVPGKVDFESLSMGWFRGVKVTDLSFDDAGGATSVKVKQIVTRPHYGSLVLGRLSFGRTVIEQPQVRIRLAEPGQKKAAASTNKTSPQVQSEATELPIQRMELVVKDGSLSITDRGGKTVELSEVNSRVKLQPPGQQTSLDVGMTVTADEQKATVHTTGVIKRERAGTWSLAGTSGDMSVEIKDLHLASLSSLFELAAVNIDARGIVSADVKSEIRNGLIESLSGQVKCRDLQLSGGPLKGDRLKTSRLDIGVNLRRQKDLITIDTLEVQSDWANVTASGVVPTSTRSLQEFVKADSAYQLKADWECDLAAILSQMPETLGTDKQLNLTSGQFSGDIATSTAAGQKKIVAEATLDKLAGTVRGKAISLSQPLHGQAAVTSDNKGIRYDRLNLSGGFGQVNCTGSNELLQYQADMNLAALQSEFGHFIDTGGYGLAGKISSTGRLASSKDTITIDGLCAVNALEIRSPQGAKATEPETKIDFSVETLRKEKIVRLNSIETTAGLGRISIKDGVVPLSKEAAQDLEVTVSAKIDLAKVLPFAALWPTFPTATQLAGMAESEISIKGIKDGYRIVTDKTIITDLEISRPRQEPFRTSPVSVIFDTEINPAEKTINIKQFELTSPEIKIKKGQFRKFDEGNETKVQGQIDFVYDWSAVAAVTGAYLPAGLKITGQRAGRIGLSSAYPQGQTDKLMANLNTKAKLGFDRAEYKGLNFGSTDVDIDVQNGVLKIAPFSTKVNNGTLNFAGAADFNRKPTLLQIPQRTEIIKNIQITDTMSKELLTYLNPIFANAVNVSGAADFDCEKLAIPLAGGDKKDIEVVGTVAISNLRLQASDLLGRILSVIGQDAAGKVITIHPTRFVLRNGVLGYENMQMDVGNNPVNFKGSIGLDKSLDMSVILPYTTAGKTVRVGQEGYGGRITLPLRGTVDRPELDLGKLLEQQLKEQLLRRGLEELFK